MDRPIPGFEETIQSGLGAWGIEAEPQQLALMRRHFDAVCAANQTMNLTRITDSIEAAVKHYLDSLAVLPWQESRIVHQDAPYNAKGGQTSVLDVGTGAGYPAVPIAIMRPDWRITALDGTRKKAEFVRNAARDLGLKHLSVEHGHSDHWASDRRFDLVLARAVASLGDGMRTCRRFLRKSGRMVAYKTAKLADDEMEGARRAADELAMVIEEPFPYELRCGTDVLARALYTVRVA